MPDPLPPANPTPLLRPATRRVAAVLLFLFGLQLWLTAGKGYWRDAEPRLLLLLLIACSVPPLARRATSLLDRLRQPRPRTALLIALLLGLLASAYILYDARRDHRALAPRYQDEFSYLIQTQQLAHGRLWLPAHPLPDFFDSFQLLTQPVYASIYFPGTALMHAPGVWLGLPPYAMPLACAGATVAVLFLLATYLFDGVAGLLAAVMLVSLPIFRRMATKPMAQVPALLLALLAVGCYLRWRRDRSTRFALLTGFFLAFAAVTRPVDALCAAFPIAIAMLLDLLRPLDRIALARTAVAMLVAALPFLALQAAFNLGVTGRVDRTPFRLYLDRDLPGTQFGFHPPDPHAHPQSPLPQKREYYDQTVGPELAAHRPAAAAKRWLQSRLPVVLTFDTPHPMLLSLLPVGLLAAGQRRRWVLFATAPAFVLLYYFYPFFFPHYGLIAAPALLLLTLASVDAARHAFPRLSPQLPLFLVASVLALTLVQYREFNRHVVVDPLVDTQFTRIDNLLSALPGRAIVLFRYPGAGNYELEPVYNPSAPWPDGARVIRAHDLGPARNSELFRYYADLHPDRTVYRYDRADDTLTPLGNVRDLASEAPSPIISSSTP